MSIAKVRISSVLVLLALASHPSDSQADGSFWQVDLAPGSVSAVASVVRGDLTYGAVYSNTDGSAAAIASVGYAFPLRDWATVKFGPSLGATRDEGEPLDDVEPGLKATVDRYAPTEFGALYLLAEVNTIDRSWFALAQASFGSEGFSAEISRGGSDTYDEASLAFNKRIEEAPLSLRAGYRFFAREVFVGFSVNTF
ncbi:hypothetical protein SAMN04490244_101233 [Tranquillimonas rosea]|uniref:Outer membrane protein beta-barrel domain-containing protein n=1 Tax=Tranquillimonas rosea TaxID=641238 RepID=A0A1H9PMJ4_9RHOB|nr:hypothetical protein [Tranquillimonas rosea]SER48793.1 hypothetical protein SAMN04490244_101233 [Tranquillimonas rosea]